MRVDDEWLDNPSTKRLIDELRKDRKSAQVALDSAARASSDAAVREQIARIDQINRMMTHITGQIGSIE